MRVAIVTPYSWTYPGGVNGHVDALARELIARGHELRVLAPSDPPDRLEPGASPWRPGARRAARLRGRRSSRTKAFGANGSVSNIGIFPDGVTKMRRELRAFGPDVVHVHEPPAGPLTWDACSYGGAPVVATFHAYSTKPLLNHVATLAGARRKFNQLAGRIAVSEAAAWTGRRWFGGTYDVIPNGVDVDAPPAGAEAARRRAAPGLRRPPRGAQGPARAADRVRGADRARGRPPDRDRRRPRRGRPPPRRSRAPRRGSRRSAASHGDELWRRLHEADLLCAPSLTGESFGMILTEAFAAGTPVLASNIAGYADVVTDGEDGILVPPADPQRLAEELQALSRDPRAPRARWARRRASPRSATPGRGRRRGRAASTSARSRSPSRRPRGERARAPARADAPPTASRRVPARRLPSLDPEPARRRAAATAPRGGSALGVAAAIGRRADLHRRAADRRRPGGDQHRPLRRDLGPGRDRR